MHILQKILFVSSTEKVSTLHISAFSITQFVRGFAATLSTAIYGIQSLESTFSPGSDFCNGKTHKVSSEWHMRNLWKAKLGKQWFLLVIRVSLWYIEMGVIGSKSSTLACFPSLQVSLRINTEVLKTDLKHTFIWIQHSFTFLASYHS